MPRAALLVMDSLGIGGAADAAAFGDAGADTFGHIVEACAQGRADRAGLRKGPLHIPFLSAHGLGLAAEASRGASLQGLARPSSPQGLWGFAREVSKGKDTPSGHWEIAGAPVDFFYLDPLVVHPVGIGIAKRATHPNTAALFFDLL